jgi:predicted FMN-binding regulatory protein PaiB
MPAGAETFILPEWISIRDRKRCALPEWQRCYVKVRGRQSFYIYDHAAIDPLRRLTGPSMWRGYPEQTGDPPGNEVGAALPAELWFQLQFRMMDSYQALAVIRFERNEHGVFMWWHPHMKTGTDKHGNHDGWHPCAVIEVPRNYIELWLEEVTR